MIGKKMFEYAHILEIYVMIFAAGDDDEEVELKVGRELTRN